MSLGHNFIAVRAEFTAALTFARDFGKASGSRKFAQGSSYPERSLMHSVARTLALLVLIRALPGRGAGIPLLRRSR